MVVGSKENRKLRVGRIAAVASVLVLGFVLLQFGGLFPGSGANTGLFSLGSRRSAAECVQNTAAQQPWQELGQCQVDAKAVKSKLDQYKIYFGELEDGEGNITKSKRKFCRCAKCHNEGVECSQEQLKQIEPTGELAALLEKFHKLTDRYNELQAAYDRMNNEKSKLDSMKGGGVVEAQVITEEAMKAAKEAIQACSKSSPADTAFTNVNIKGSLCTATDQELAQYFNYTAREACPDDWFFVQDLIFNKNCHSLPRRRCISRTAPDAVDPLPYPRSLWEQKALEDKNVRWDLHHCKSFECLNSRLRGDCRNCFDLDLEAHRWKNYYRGAISMRDVIAMKNNTLRIGLDAGGGTGSFAAQMATFGVTILTTAMNVETVIGRRTGIPYMETIALRGLVGLHLPHKARLPFFDNSMDVVHSVNSIKYLPLVEFEELVMEWDRVLRPGGIMWFEMFYAPVGEMPLYVAILDLLRYKRLYWNNTPKPDKAEMPGDHVYLNCVIEKPARKD